MPEVARGPVPPAEFAFLAAVAADHQTDGPVPVADQVRRLLRARRQLAQKFNREPTLAELARMIQVGDVPGPAVRWKAELVGLFRKIATP